MAKEMKSFTLYIDEIKLRRLKAIAAVRGIMIREVVNEMADLYLAKFAEDDLGKRIMSLPFEERFSQAIGQQAKENLKERSKGKKRKGKAKS